MSWAWDWAAAWSFSLTVSGGSLAPARIRLWASRTCARRLARSSSGRSLRTSGDERSRGGWRSSRVGAQAQPARNAAATAIARYLRLLVIAERVRGMVRTIPGAAAGPVDPVVSVCPRGSGLEAKDQGIRVDCLLDRG